MDHEVENYHWAEYSISDESSLHTIIIITHSEVVDVCDEGDAEY